MFDQNPWARFGPNIIGATGGSGTRVVARIVRRGGLFIGTDLNPSEDAVAFGEYSDRWINTYLAPAGRLARWLTRLRMEQHLRRLLRKHLAPLGGIPRLWGWKEPRCIYLLPFWASEFASLRFLHVVRDGRDMAYSSNQNQLRKHGHMLLAQAEREWAQPLRSITLWARINLRAADFGERHLRDRYLRIRFEDLCLDPVPAIARILEFFALAGEPSEIAALEPVSPPPGSLGRWKERQAEPEAAELWRLGGPALQQFGYPA